MEILKVKNDGEVFFVGTREVPTKKQVEEIVRLFKTGPVRDHELALQCALCQVLGPQNQAWSWEPKMRDAEFYHVIRIE